MSKDKKEGNKKKSIKSILKTFKTIKHNNKILKKLKNETN
jgi:hypothetical protein